MKIIYDEKDMQEAIKNAEERIFDIFAIKCDFYSYNNEYNYHKCSHKAYWNLDPNVINYCKKEYCPYIEN